MGRHHEDAGFTIIELMVVVLIITILTAIAVPVITSTRARAAKSACFSNERVVEGAWARYSGAGEGTAVAGWPELMDVIVPSELATEPACPSGGEYSLDVTGLAALCSEHGSYHADR